MRRRSQWCGWFWFFALVLALPAHGADIGGWVQEKARNDLLIDDCAEVPALAVRTPRHAPNAAAVYFAAGLCYLESPKLPRDPFAAAAWLGRAADLGHQPARRVLQQLQLQTPP